MHLLDFKPSITLIHSSILFSILLLLLTFLPQVPIITVNLNMLPILENPNRSKVVNRERERSNRGDDNRHRASTRRRGGFLRWRHSFLGRRRSFLRWSFPAEKSSTMTTNRRCGGCGGCWLRG
ncbi:hypothetical protein AAHE18_20G238700 [Arachis hypogaea]